jgi:hypothetical protein
MEFPSPPLSVWDFSPVYERGQCFQLILGDVNFRKVEWSIG